jgi:2-phospho-L-lactate/phosphoenolpyruvate guanylyltransferase
LNRLAVLIPFKGEGVKSRLSGLLGPRERREFALALLGDVLEAFRSARLVSSCYVVTADPRAKEVASKAGSGVIAEPSASGVNAAVRLGVDRLGPAMDFLVVPSDIPLLRSMDVKELIAMRSGGLDVVIVPSRAFDGTNALLFGGAGQIPLSYDDHSFWNHVQAAGALKRSLGIYSGDGFRFDVDTEEDFRALARSGGRKDSVKLARRVLA